MSNGTSIALLVVLSLWLVCVMTLAGCQRAAPEQQHADVVSNATSASTSVDETNAAPVTTPAPDPAASTVVRIPIEFDTEAVPVEKRVSLTFDVRDLDGRVPTSAVIQDARARGQEQHDWPHRSYHWTPESPTIQVSRYGSRSFCARAISSDDDSLRSGWLEFEKEDAPKVVKLLLLEQPVLTGSLRFDPRLVPLACELELIRKYDGEERADHNDWKRPKYSLAFPAQSESHFEFVGVQSGMYKVSVLSEVTPDSGRYRTLFDTTMYVAGDGKLDLLLDYPFREWGYFEVAVLDSASRIVKDGTFQISALTDNVHYMADDAWYFQLRNGNYLVWMGRLPYWSGPVRYLHRRDSDDPSQVIKAAKEADANATPVYSLTAHVNGIHSSFPFTFTERPQDLVVLTLPEPGSATITIKHPKESSYSNALFLELECDGRTIRRWSEDRTYTFDYPTMPFPSDWKLRLDALRPGQHTLRAGYLYHDWYQSTGRSMPGVYELGAVFFDVVAGQNTDQVFQLPKLFTVTFSVPEQRLEEGFYTLGQSAQDWRGRFFSKLSGRSFKIEDVPAGEYYIQRQRDDDNNREFLETMKINVTGHTNVTFVPDKE